MSSVRNVLEELAVSTPAYDRVVQNYGLTMLMSPGDLQIENGDLAATKDGRDLKFGDTAYNALFRFANGWRFNAPTFKLLFDLVYGAKQKKGELEKRLDQEAPSLIAMIRTPMSLDLYHQINDEIGATETAYSATATALLLAISGMLTLFKMDVEAGSEWQSVEPLIGGYSVGAIIDATANNFRHRDEWALGRATPNTRQLTSIRVLAAALNEPILPDGSEHRMSRDVGHEILDVLSGGDFEMLSARIFSFVNAMAERLRSSSASSLRIS